MHAQAESVPLISSHKSLCDLWHDYAEGNPELGRKALAAKEADWAAAGKPRDKCWRAKKDKDTWYTPSRQAQLCTCRALPGSAMLKGYRIKCDLKQPSSA